MQTQVFHLFEEMPRRMTARSQAGICWVFREAAKVSSKWQRRCALLPITREFPLSTTSPAPGGVSVLILVLLIGVSCLHLTTSRVRFSILSLAASVLPNCFKWKPLLVFVCQAAVPKYCNLSGLNNRDGLAHSLGGGKSRIKVSWGRAPLRALRKDLLPDSPSARWSWARVRVMALFTWRSPWVRVLFCKDTSQTGLGVCHSPI